MVIDAQKYKVAQKKSTQKSKGIRNGSSCTLLFMYGYVYISTCVALVFNAFVRIRLRMARVTKC